MKKRLGLLGFVSFLLAAGVASAAVATYPAPAGAGASGDYAVTVNGQPLFVYSVDALNGGPASFAYFDFSGTVDVAIQAYRPAGAVKVLPAACGIKPRVQGGEIRFTLTRPRNLTLEVGGFARALHLFANPIETNVPRRGDPGVIYFGPGVHEVTTLTLASGATLYLAGGAVLKAVLAPGERPTTVKDWSGVKNYRPFMELRGVHNVRIRGRGIIDLSGLPWHARSGIVLEGASNISIEGIIMLDAPAWAMSMFNSQLIRIENIKQLCRRVNSDGIDICNSQDVVVRGCFLRNNDDEICVKTTQPAPAQEAKMILVEGCVIWNERARGLGITSETRRDISNVTFRDCDIIHDFSGGGDCSALAILVSDSGTMRNIAFENIRIEQAQSRLIRCWVGKDMWGHDATRGRIDGVVFRNITVTGNQFPSSDLIGCDAAHLIQNVSIEGLRIQGKEIGNAEAGKIMMNGFVKGVRFGGAK